MMSSPVQTPKTSQGPGERRSRRELVRTGSLLVLAVLATLFAVFNLKEVRVSYVFGSGKAPLIIVIVVSLLVGIVLTYFAGAIPVKAAEGARLRRV